MKDYNQITTEPIRHDSRYLDLPPHKSPTPADASPELTNL